MYSLNTANNENIQLQNMEKLEKSPPKDPELPQADANDLMSECLRNILYKVHVIRDPYVPIGTCKYGLLLDEDKTELSSYEYANRAAQILYNIGVECIKNNNQKGNELKNQYWQLLEKNPSILDENKKFLQAVFVIRVGLNQIQAEEIYNKNPNDYYKTKTCIPLFDQLKTDLEEFIESKPIVLPYITNKQLPSMCELPSHQTLFCLTHLYISEHPKKFGLTENDLPLLYDNLSTVNDSLSSIYSLCEKYMSLIKINEENANSKRVEYKNDPTVYVNLNPDPKPKDSTCSIF